MTLVMRFLFTLIIVDDTTKITQATMERSVPSPLSRTEYENFMFGPNEAARMFIRAACKIRTYCRIATRHKAI